MELVRDWSDLVGIEDDVDVTGILKSAGMTWLGRGGSGREVAAIGFNISSLNHYLLVS